MESTADGAVRGSNRPLSSGLCLGRSVGTRRFCLDGAEQLHQVPDLDAFERTYGILDFAAEPLVDSAGDQSVKLLDLVVPREWMGSETGIVLNLVFDYIPVL